jgi:hypothetical protein
MSLYLPLPIRGWRAALVLAAVVLFNSGDASAACGDYITYANTPKSEHAEPTTTKAHTTSPTKPPCEGPNCSGVPLREFPSPPPAPVTNQTKEQVRVFVPHEDDVTCYTFERDPSFPRPIDRADSIFHPPRLG